MTHLNEPLFTIFNYFSTRKIFNKLTDNVAYLLFNAK